MTDDTDYDAFALDEYPHLIKEAVGKSRDRLRYSLEWGLKAGNYMIAAKEKVKADGGHWLRWLKDNTGFGNRTAQYYMRLSRHHADILAQHDKNASLALKTMADVYRLACAKYDRAEKKKERQPKGLEAKYERLWEGIKRVGKDNEGVFNFFDWLLKEDTVFEEWVRAQQDERDDDPRRRDDEDRPNA